MSGIPLAMMLPWACSSRGSGRSVCRRVTSVLSDPGLEAQNGPGQSEPNNPGFHRNFSFY
jgi:hypothetical protein